MITLRPSKERGHTQIGWLDSYHTFSFSDYYDEKHMNFGKLRMINEDRVEPGEDFGTHGHRDMEIITKVNNQWRLSDGDGAAIYDDALMITAIEPAEILLFDLKKSKEFIAFEGD